MTGSFFKSSSTRASCSSETAGEHTNTHIGGVRRALP
jgi:hypothetical protein